MHVANIESAVVQSNTKGAVMLPKRYFVIVSSLLATFLFIITLVVLALSVFAVKTVQQLTSQVQDDRQHLFGLPIVMQLRDLKYSLNTTRINYEG